MAFPAAVKASPSSTIPPNLASLFPFPRTPWRMSPELFKRMQKQASEVSGDKAKPFVACELSQSDPECAAVMRYFLEQKPQNYGIKSILCVHNPAQTQNFEGSLQLMEAGAKNFPPTWRDEEPKLERANAMKCWDEQTRQFSPIEISSSKRTDKIVSCRVIPVWHGTNRAESICSSGFAIFGKHHLMNSLAKAGVNKSNDIGFFGSGIYGTNSADYAFRYAHMSGSDTLLFTFFAMREPFPVVSDVPIPGKCKDMYMLEGQGAYQNYNGHYIRVTSAYPKDADNMAYHPCYKGEKAAWDEYVVFQTAQTLVRYIVKVGVDFPVAPSAPMVAATVKTLLDKVFELLEMPAIKGNKEVANLLSKKAEALLTQYSNSPLSAQDQEFHRWVEQLLDPAGKLRSFVQQKLSQLPTASTSHYDVKDDRKSPEKPSAPKPSVEIPIPSKSSIAKPLSELESLQQRASDGDAEAQRQLGYLYCYGQKGANQNYITAREWWEMAAAQGCANAQCAIGELYYLGRGVEQSYTIAGERYEKAAALGDAEAQHRLGVLYYYGQKGVNPNFTTARIWFEKAAARGEVRSQWHLGFLYENGNGVVKNRTIARSWYEMAAAQNFGPAKDALAKLKSELESLEKCATDGDAEAQFNLGMRYHEGDGVKQDASTARVWFEKAAASRWWSKAPAKGHAGAQFQLGLLYKGNDLATARRWYEKAAAQGYAPAKDALAKMQATSQQSPAASTSHYDVKDGQKSPEKPSASKPSVEIPSSAKPLSELELLQQCAAAGDAEAQCALGRRYFTGKGVEQNYTTASIWLEKAAVLGHAEAQHTLGTLYKTGSGVVQNFTTACGWHQRAAAQGHAWAQWQVGWFYHKGKGVVKNIATARGWYEKAAAQGNVRAKNDLAKM